MRFGEEINLIAEKINETKSYVEKNEKRKSKN